MTPICPKCHFGMKLLPYTPDIGALPTLRAYRCGPCRCVFTEAEGIKDEQRALTLAFAPMAKP